MHKVWVGPSTTVDKSETKCDTKLILSDAKIHFWIHLKLFTSRGTPKETGKQNSLYQINQRRHKSVTERTLLKEYRRLTEKKRVKYAERSKLGVKYKTRSIHIDFWKIYFFTPFLSSMRQFWIARQYTLFSDRDSGISQKSLFWQRSHCISLMPNRKYRNLQRKCK